MIAVNCPSIPLTSQQEPDTTYLRVPSFVIPCRTQAAEFLLILATHASAAGPRDESDSQEGSSQVLGSIGEELGLDFGSYVEKLMMEHSEADGLTDGAMQRICASIVDAV